MAATATVADTSTPGRMTRGTGGTAPLRALVEARQHELAMAQGFRGGEPAVAGTQHDLDQLIAGLLEVLLPLQQSRAVVVDVFGHRAHGARIGAKLDHRNDRVADDVALPGGEEMHDVAGCGA